jgi:predicted transcriptional regulator
LESAVNSFAKWDVLVFLYRHPQAVQSVDEICESISRDAEEVEEALGGLEQAGIVARKGKQGGPLYFYQPGKEWVRNIEKFIQSLSDRNQRFLMLAHIFEMKGRAG